MPSTEASADYTRVPVRFENATLGFVTGPSAPATAVALLLMHLAARESEGRALASEILHLYREVHLIEQLSEQLAALLDLSAVSQSALGQAQRLIAATHGGILVMEEADGSLRNAASFGRSSSDLVDGSGPLLSNSRFAASILERGIAEIVNNCASDPRARDSELTLQALICAPLRAGQRTVGIIALASDAADASYSAADLKLLNTIALQTAAAIANSILCAEMVDAAQAAPRSFMPPALFSSFFRVLHAPRLASRWNRSTSLLVRSVATSSSFPRHQTAPSLPLSAMSPERV